MPLNNLKIYVVDDFVPYLDLVLEFLNLTYPRLTIKGINNSVRALDIILEDRPEIVIVDHAMPERDGTELVKLICEHYKPYTILLSSLHQHKQNFDYFVYKYNDFLETTSILKDIIDTIIRNLLERQEKAIDNVVHTLQLEGSYGDLLFLKQVIRIAKRILNINNSSKKIGLYKAITKDVKKNTKYIQYHLGKIRDRNVDIFPNMDNIDVVKELVKQVNEIEEKEK